MRSDDDTFFEVYHRHLIILLSIFEALHFQNQVLFLLHSLKTSPFVNDKFCTSFSILVSKSTNPITRLHCQCYYVNRLLSSSHLHFLLRRLLVLDIEGSLYSFWAILCILVIRHSDHLASNLCWFFLHKILQFHSLSSLFLMRLLLHQIVCTFNFECLVLVVYDPLMEFLVIEPLVVDSKFISLAFAYPLVFSHLLVFLLLAVLSLEEVNSLP